MSLALSLSSLSSLFLFQFSYYTEGWYIYLEASLQKSGEKAKLLSGYMTGTQCVQFKYHMLGSGIGTLRVYQIKRKDSTPRVVWYRVGDQGEDWKNAQFNLFGRFYRVSLRCLGDVFHWSQVYGYITDSLDCRKRRLSFRPDENDHDLYFRIRLTVMFQKILNCQTFTETVKAHSKYLK